MKEVQQGELKNHSSLTAIACVHDIVMKFGEEKQPGSILLIDLTAACNLFDHEIINEKLEAYKFGPGIRKWIRSYLNQRTYRVEIIVHKQLMVAQVE